jgi:hypothetical protein
VRRAAAAGAAAALLITGCGRTVGVEPLPQSGSSAQQCAALVAELPAQSPAGRRWTVAPDPSSTAAWGSGPVVLRCGPQVPQPAPTDQLLAVDGVDWWVVPLSDGERFTTVGRTPGVEVRVPASAGIPAAQFVAAINASVAAGTTTGG